MPNDIIAQLKNSQSRLSACLIPVADDQDWRPRPGAWSFREIAAHLATAESECLQPRLKRIASGEHPHFELYLNTDRDFSGFYFCAALRDWANTRQAIFDFVRGLTVEQLTLTATHAFYGTLTVPGYLQAWLAHDQEHLDELERLLIQHAAEKAHT